ALRAQASARQLGYFERDSTSTETPSTAKVHHGPGRLLRPLLKALPLAHHDPDRSTRRILKHRLSLRRRDGRQRKTHRIARRPVRTDVSEGDERQQRAALEGVERQIWRNEVRERGRGRGPTAGT